MLFRFGVAKKPLSNRFRNVLGIMVLSLSILSSNTIARETITLKKAITLTIEQHPELAAFAFRKEALQGLIQQAGVTTPVSVQIGLDNALGGETYSGFSNIETSMGISWLLEGDIIDARINLANKQADLTNFEREIKVLDLAAETARIFIILISQQQELKLAKVAQEQSSEVLTEVSKRVKAGQAKVIDQLRAKANLAKKNLVVEDLLHEIEATRAELAAQWQGESVFEVQGSLIEIPSLIEVENAISNLRDNPRFKLFTSTQRLIQSKIELAKATQEPTWKLNAGIKKDNQINDYAVSAGISIPWGSSNRNRGKISAFQAEKFRSQAEADALAKRLTTQLLLLTHKLKHNIHIVNSLSKSVIPDLKQANKEAEKAYKLGSYRYSEWYTVQQELVTAQMELIKAYANIQLFNIDIEHLTGSSITKQVEKS